MQKLGNYPAGVVAGSSISQYIQSWSFTTDPCSQLNIFGHDRHTLGMDGT
jgi:hypothetical protein